MPERDKKYHKNIIKTKHVIFLLVLVFIAVAFLIRVLPPYDSVFAEDESIRYTSVDAYYHMHLVDNMASNYPQSTNFYPYLEYPLGFTQEPSFFSKMITTVVMIVGLGTPNQHTIDMVGVYTPVVLAMLVVLTIFIIGTVLFNKWAGLIMAGLLAVLPGEYLGRSALGSTDHHIAEVLFSLLAMLFLIMAIRSALEKGIAFNNVVKKDWKVIRKPLIYSLISGAILGVYLSTWLGGLLFVFIITLYMIIQIIINHFRNINSEYLGIIGLPLFVIAYIVYLILSPAYNSYILLVAMMIPLVLSIISTFMMSHDIKKYYYPLSIMIIGGLAVGIFFVAVPTLAKGLWYNFSYMFFPSGTSASTVMEMQPFLSPTGTFSTSVAWGNFTTSFFLTPKWAIPGIGFMGLILLLYRTIKNKNGTWILFLVWTMIILTITLIQRRFAYYLAVNMAVLSAYFAWELLWVMGVKNIVKKMKANNKTRYARGFFINYVNMAVCMALIISVLLYPNVAKANEQTGGELYSPSDAWQSSLEWVRSNTPEPLGSEEDYYQLYDSDTFEYPETAYSVTAWWDYGYWITRIAHRLPNREPEMNKVANLFLSENEENMEEIIEELDTRYIILDYDIVTSKFWALAEWSNIPLSKYQEMYYIVKDNQLVQAMIFYPAYYETLCVRLYNFNNGDNNVYPFVINYVYKTASNGKQYKVITDVIRYDDYNKAVEYVQENGGLVVGLNPFQSPIPLNPFDDLEIVYDSLQQKETNMGMLPEIRVIEYNGLEMQ